jgi:hypothetical protein
MAYAGSMRCLGAFFRGVAEGGHAAAKGFGGIDLTAVTLRLHG